MEELENGTNCQKIVYAEMIEVFKKISHYHVPPTKVYTIAGAAGVGKSWLTSMLVKKAIDLKVRCFLSTPTHKAVGVLREMLVDLKLEDNPKVNTGTIHNFLNLKLEHDFEDETNLNPTTPKLIKNIHNQCLITCDVLFVDEASMIDQNIYQIIREELGDRFKIVIFIGDYYQLPPVGSSISPIFTEHGDNKVMFLTETVRQKAGSYIINRTLWLKYYIDTQIFPPNILDLFETFGEVEVFDSRDPVRHNEFVSLYFSDKENTKVVGTYTNDLVDMYNKYIRDTELNFPTDLVVEGERLIVQSPYENSNGDIVFTSNQEIEVDSIRIIDNTTSKYKLYRITTTDGENASILHEDSFEAYSAEVESLLQTAKAINTADKKNRGRAWSKYFDLMTRFLKVKSAYSSTIHKLQGSTYDNTYLDLRTIPKFYGRNPDLMCRLLYVGITRPRKNLYILK